MGELEEKLNTILGDQEAMGRIMALAQSLGSASPPAGGEGEGPGRSGPAPDLSGPAPDLSQAMSGVDPKLMQLGLRLLQEYQRDDQEKAALLQALRPFLREERRERLDKAVQMAKLSRVVRVALGSLGKKGADGLV